MLGLYITMLILGPLIFLQNMERTVASVVMRIIGAFMFMVAAINFLLMWLGVQP